MEGLQHTLASGNAFVDQVAKGVVHSYKTTSALYQTVVRSKLGAIKIRHQVDSFHLHLAFASLGLEQDVPIQSVTPVPLVRQGSPWVAVPPVLSRNGFHESFVRQVFNWLCSLQWFEGCSPGPVRDIAWVELFLWWTVDSGTLPPFRVDGRWVRIGDDEEAICCVPSAAFLYLATCGVICFASWDVDTWCASLGRFFGGQFGGFFCPFWGYLASSRSAGGTSGFGFAAFCDSVFSLVAFTPLVVNSLLDSWPATPLAMFPVSHL